jgi:hypothetical protein
VSGVSTSSFSSSSGARVSAAARVAALAVATWSFVGGASTAQAQPRGAKPPPVVKACGVSAIPLVVGNEWTYEPVAPPPEAALTDAQIKLTPLQPKKLVVKVTAIDTKDGVTTVALHEDHDGRGHDTSISCSAGGAKFAVAMDAFWFAGEAGPAIGIELTNVERKGQTLLLTGGKVVQPDWHDDITASWKHVTTGKATPALRAGTIALLRHWVLQPDETITTKAGVWTSKKLGLETTIKLTIDPPPPLPLKDPALLVNFLWIADGVGPVQVLNSFGQMYQLTSVTLAK